MQPHDGIPCSDKYRTIFIYLWLRPVELAFAPLIYLWLRPVGLAFAPLIYLWLRPVGLAFAPLIYLWLRPVGLAFAPLIFESEWRIPVRALGWQRVRRGS